MSNNNQSSKIAKNLKKIRQDKGISQDRLSKLADLSLNGLLPKSLFQDLTGVERPYPHIANNDFLPKL